MRLVQILLILFLGGSAVYLECRDIKEWSLFGSDVFEAVPLFGLCVLTIVYLFKDGRQFQKQKNLAAFLPSVTGLLFLTATVGHMLLRTHYYNSPTVFTATNFNLGRDDVFTLDFKKNNHLKGEKIDRLSSTTYWGTYRQKKDTLILDISLDFTMGRQAVIQDSILRFIDDTVRFEVFRR